MATSPPAIAKALRERRRREQAGERNNPYDDYRFRPVDYICDKLKWTPWGEGDNTGQHGIIKAYEKALLQQWDRHRWEQGEHVENLEHWQPGDVIQNWIRVESGHLIGKTKLASGIFSHFFDCFRSIIYTFAPSEEQINDLLWKEIRNDRRTNNLPGVVQDVPRLKHSPDHFATGKATNNANDAGTERVQGQHHPYLMFILDEAEGIPDFVYDAIEGMDTGVIVIVLLLANPRTRTSKFYKLRSLAHVQSFRVSTIEHPNVVSGKQEILGAATRDWVDKRLDSEEYVDIVDEHDEDDYTFEVPWRPGVIYKPKPMCYFRILGIAPANIADNTFVPVGRYEAACTRKPKPPEDERTWARMGVDVARYGNDFGTLYIRCNGRAWRSRQFAQQDTNAYRDVIRAEAIKLKAQGVTSLHIRVDAGGGFSSGIVDPLKRDDEMQKMFADFRLIEVHFNGTPHDDKAYDDLVTEMYAESAETLKGIAILNPPDALEDDLTMRSYKWVNKSGRSVKRLVDKEQFRKAEGRSPDDGDGFVMAAAPDHIFAKRAPAFEVRSFQG